MNDTSAIIIGTGCHHPPDAVSNAELVESFNAFVERANATRDENSGIEETGELLPSSVEFIIEASGIEGRYVVDREGILDPERMKPHVRQRADDELSLQAEMGLRAAQEALQGAGIDAGEIDAVICAATFIQRAYPAIAIEIQNALGAHKAFAYDMSVACSSTTFALDAATNLIRCGRARTVLVVTPEIGSAFTNWEKRDSHFIFADAAVALVVCAEGDASPAQGWEIVDQRLASRFSNNLRHNFGFLNPVEEPARPTWDMRHKQRGRAVYRELVPYVSDIVIKQCRDIGITPADLRRFWMHQANKRLNRKVVQRILGRKPTDEEAPDVIQEYANTAAAGSLIAFHKQNADMASGDHGLICSYGGGYSVGSLIVRRR